MAEKENHPMTREEENIFVGLTHEHLNVDSIMAKVKSPKAGAIVLFAGKRNTTSFKYSLSLSNHYFHIKPLSQYRIHRHIPIRPFKLTHPPSTGTTRDTFAQKTVKHLAYQSYAPLALSTLLKIAKSIKLKHSLTAIAMIHRLGVVPIGEESILIAVSSPHRLAAWRAGEEALEECKEKAEIWKLEEFEGEEGVWRANRDGAVGERVS